MRRTIEEIQGYFDERPELWAEINKDLVDNFRKDESQSIVEWGKEIQEQDDIAAEKIIRDIVGAFRYIMPESEQEVEFKKWVNWEWHEEHVIGYKGFNKDLTNQGFQYEIGKEYEYEGAVWIDEGGFYACENPLEALRLYNGPGKRYCIVEQWGYIEENFSIRVSSNIKIVREISLKEMVDIAAEKMEKTMPQPPIEENEDENMIEVEFGEEDGIESMPNLYDGNFRDMSNINPQHPYVGRNSNLILRYDYEDIANVIGDDNIIIAIGNYRTFNISGSDNQIYIFGTGNNVNVIGDDGILNVVEGGYNQIVVKGNRFRIYTKETSDMICVGERNAVRAGNGSRITFIYDFHPTSIVIDGKDYAEDNVIYFNSGIIEKANIKEI